MKKNVTNILKGLFLTIIPTCLFAQTTLTSCSYEIVYDYKQQVTPFLHEIDYDDFPEDRNFVTLQHQPLNGCSAFYKDGYFCRNFDQCFNTMPEFVVRVKASEKRHGSIGLSCHYGLRYPSFLSYKYRTQLNFLPNHMLDGINDCGVVCEANTVNYEEDWEKWVGTNPDKPDIPQVHVSFLVRYILDHANSAKHAIQLLDDINIMGSKTYHESESFGILHYLIADQNDAFIVELKDNKMIVIDTHEKNINPVLTNFYINPLVEDTDLYPSSFGIERYDILNENYASTPKTLEGVKELIKSVSYSHFYNPHIDDPENFWLSETFDLETKAIFIKYLNGGAMTKSEMEVVNNVLAQIEYFRSTRIPQFWKDFQNGWRTESSEDHISIHSVVYDLNQLSVSVVTGEDFENYYSFSLLDN